MAFPAVGNIAHSDAIRQNLIGRIHTKVLANPANGTGLDTVYYDGQMMLYRHCDYFNDTSKLSWDQSFAAPYRDYWVIGQGAGQGFRVFSEGLTRDYQANGTAASLTALNILGSIAGWAQPSGFQDPLNDDIFYSREVAYAAMLHMDLKKVASATYSPSRLTTLKNWMLDDHVVNWGVTQAVGLSQFYIRPFMCALTSIALMRYYNEISPDPLIISRLNTLWSFICNTMWRAGDARPSFQYTNVATSTMSSTVPNTDEQAGLVNTGDTEASPDLSLLIVPIFGWLWLRTGNTSWITGTVGGDAVYSNGVSIYTNDAANTTDPWISGAFFGTPSNTGVNGKHFDQNYWYSDIYLTMRGQDPDTGGTPNVLGRCKTVGSLACLGAGSGLSTTTPGTASYTLSGLFTLSGVGLPGVTMTSAAIGNVTTDGTGYYSYPGVMAGTAYTVTPSLTGYTFTPVNSAGTLNADTTTNFVATATAAYDPLSFFTGGTRSYWRISDQADVLNTTLASAVNEEFVRRVLEDAGGSYLEQAGADSLKPVCKTGVANGKQSTRYTGAQYMDPNAFTGFVQNTDIIGMWVVIRLYSTPGNARLFRAYDNSFSVNRVNFTLAGDSPAMDVSNVDTIGPQQTLTTTAHLSVVATGFANLHFLFYEYNAAGAAGRIRANGANLTLTGSFPAAANIPNTASVENRVGALLDGDILEIGLVKGYSAVNNTGLEAATKSFFGITNY